MAVPGPLGGPCVQVRLVRKECEAEASASPPGFHTLRGAPRAAVRLCLATVLGAAVAVCRRAGPACACTPLLSRVCL